MLGQDKTFWESTRYEIGYLCVICKTETAEHLVQNYCTRPRPRNLSIQLIVQGKTVSRQPYISTSEARQDRDRTFL